MDQAVQGQAERDLIGRATGDLTLPAIFPLNADVEPLR